MDMVVRRVGTGSIYSCQAHARRCQCRFKHSRRWKQASKLGRLPPEGIRGIDISRRKKHGRVAGTRRGRLGAQRGIIPKCSDYRAVLIDLPVVDCQCFYDPNPIPSL